MNVKDEPSIKEPNSRNTSGNASGAPKTMRYVFGIFMIIVYLGMGYLMFANFFMWGPEFDWARYSLGALFILYGFWRAYRQFRGMY